MWQIEFESNKFLPYLPDECQVNPGLFGFELAHWLSLELSRRGVITSYPISEDWGWFLELTEGDFEIMICCSGYQENHDEDPTTPIKWGIFLKPQLSIAKKLKRISTDNAIRALGDAILAILSSNGIQAQQVQDA